MLHVVSLLHQHAFRVAIVLAVLAAAVLLLLVFGADPAQASHEYGQFGDACRHCWRYNFYCKLLNAFKGCV